MPLPERTAGDVVIVTVSGDLTSSSGVGAQLRESVQSLLQQGHRKLVLDLAGTRQLDSTGLGEIVHAYASTKNRGGTMKLLQPSRRTRELLTITKLQSVLESYDTEADVVAAFPS